MVRAAAGRLYDFVRSQPPQTVRGPLLFAASPLPGGGAIVRVAGDGAETVGRWLRQNLGFVPPLLGDDPWARKW